MNEEELVKKLQKGDEKAFEEIYEMYGGRIMNFINSIARNREDALDLTAEVFIKVWKKARTLRNLKSFKSWIFTIAANITKNFLKKKRPQLFDDSEDILKDSKTPVSIYYKNKTGEEVEKNLNRLSPIHREILILFYFENFSVKEIAKLLDIPEGTVLSRLKRARESFRRKYDGV